MKRAIVIVIDSMGIGAMPDSLEFGDDSTVNTLCNLAKANNGINVPNFEKMGLGNIKDIEGVKKSEWGNIGIGKTNFIDVVVDAYHIKAFGIERSDIQIDTGAIVSIYKTNSATKDLMDKLGISFLDINKLDETTLFLTKEQFVVLKEKAPYLIAMAVTDIAELSYNDTVITQKSVIDIPHPGNEPIVGVIDTLFDERVYFSEWVEYKCMLDDNIPVGTRDYYHGTEVTSIIVDGPSFNENLNDGCGRFRVRHFGVTTATRFSSFSVMKAIKQIVETNRDIKVWNLSLGSDLEINTNFISPEAALLDKLQYENDVVFIIAGTNDNNPPNGNFKRIGAPADSINAVVVNAVNEDNQPASYSRIGPVLSFFNKPDISYYGGEGENPIVVCSPLGVGHGRGTSFAAPWITRKMAYLIHILGFDKEVAKALLIDAASGWNEVNGQSCIKGYGVVPIRIEDITKSKPNEIKFIISDVAEKFDTYNFNLPVPMSNGKYPFYAKATLCYCSKTSRNQGVDYTNTEIDLHFGRVNGKTVKTLNDNEQCTEGVYSLYEEDARKNFRKWDNVKRICEKIKVHPKAKKVYYNANGTSSWGVRVYRKERLVSDNLGIKFGVVVTLYEMDGINRMEEFIQQCMLRGWIVNRINVENRIDIYHQAEETIVFDD